MQVPYFKQENNYVCGAAVLQMVFAYFGKNENQTKLSRQLGSTPARGTSHKSMIAVSRHYGFVCHENRHAKIQDIRNFLAKNIPVIVNYIEPSENIGHYAVVVEVDNKQLTLNDPENGKNFKISIQEFEKRWHNITGQSKRWLMAISVNNK